MPDITLCSPLVASDQDAKLVASGQAAWATASRDSTLLFATFQFHSMTDGYAEYRSAQNISPCLASQARHCIVVRCQ